MNSTGRLAVLVSCIIFGTLFCNTFCNAQLPEKKFPWTMFLPAIISAEPCKFGTYFGVFSTVCCPTSRTRFGITLYQPDNDITYYKKSDVYSCSTEGTWEGWENIPKGTYDVMYGLTTSYETCGDFLGGFQSLKMEQGYAYLFQMEFSDQELMIVVYEGDACDLINNDEVQNSSRVNSTNNIDKDVFEKYQSFRIATPGEGLFEANCISKEQPN